MVNMPDEIYGSRKIIDLPDIITSTFDFKSTYNVFLRQKLMVNHWYLAMNV